VLVGRGGPRVGLLGGEVGCDDPYPAGVGQAAGERIDTESLGLSVEMFEVVAEDLLTARP